MAARARSAYTITRRRSQRSTSVPDRIPSARLGMTSAMPSAASPGAPAPNVLYVSQVIATECRPSPTTEPVCAVQSRR